MRHDVMRFAKVAVRVWGCQMDFDHPEVTAKAGIDALRRLNEDLTVRHVLDVLHYFTFSIGDKT